MEKVKSSYSLDMKVVASMCDETSRMSIPAMLDMYQDYAGVHAESIGTGVLHLEEMGLFWVVSKLKLRFTGNPLVGNTITAATWIQPAEKVSCERDFSISEDGQVVSYVRTIWATLSRETGRPARMDGFYPEPDVVIDRPDDEPFRRMKTKFEGAEEIGSYKIRSVDIDRGGHMNNVNYVRAMLGCFTCREIEEMNISGMDLQFVSQCYEGDTIRFVKRIADDGVTEIGALDESGRAAFIAAVYFSR